MYLYVTAKMKNKVNEEELKLNKKYEYRFDGLFSNIFLITSIYWPGLVENVEKQNIE
jgi:hypothetical protein